MLRLAISCLGMMLLVLAGGLSGEGTERDVITLER